MKEIIIQDIVNSLHDKELVDRDNKRLTGLVHITDAEELIFKLIDKLEQFYNQNEEDAIS